MRKSPPRDQGDAQLCWAAASGRELPRQLSDHTRHEAARVCHGSGLRVADVKCNNRLHSVIVASHIDESAGRMDDATVVCVLDVRPGRPDPLRFEHSRRGETKHSRKKKSGSKIPWGSLQRYRRKDVASLAQGPGVSPTTLSSEHRAGEAMGSRCARHCSCGRTSSRCALNRARATRGARLHDRGIGYALSRRDRKALRVAVIMLKNNDFTTLNDTSMFPRTPRDTSRTLVHHLESQHCHTEGPSTRRGRSHRIIKNV